MQNEQVADTNGDERNLINREHAEPLPYFPQLAPAVPMVSARLVLTYLEMLHPAPQDSATRHASLPVVVEFEAIQAALQVSRRTLILALCALSAWYRSEAQRWAAQRSGREFRVAKRDRTPLYRLYSIVGLRLSPNSLVPMGPLIIRRNMPLFDATLSKCGISTFNVAPQTTPTPPPRTSNPTMAHPTSSEAAHALRAASPRLADLLLRASVLDGDRRRVRYGRLRAAVERKLVTDEVLRVNRAAKRAVRGGDGGLEAIERRMSAQKKSMSSQDGDVSGNGE